MMEYSSEGEQLRNTEDKKEEENKLDWYCQTAEAGFDFFAVEEPPDCQSMT